MTNRERFNAILHYQDYDRMPVVHFGYWDETLEKWLWEGKITEDEIDTANSCYWGNDLLNRKFGFDFGYESAMWLNTGLYPPFEKHVIEEVSPVVRKVLNEDGVVVMEYDDAQGIPSEVAHTLIDRASFETHYRHRLQPSADRWARSAIDAIKAGKRDKPAGLYVGSMFGDIRNWMGVTGTAYIYADDEDLFTEIIDMKADMTYKMVEEILKQYSDFDFAHYWEDICFKNGPLINPDVFAEKCGHHYRRMTDLLARYNIDIVSLDCDGCIDKLVPVWLKNGVNTMFPIEVGTWEASIAPWRKEYGKDLRGIGGMDKRVFAQDYAAIDKEIERLRPLVDLGGYIPCPDHRIPPDAIFENVQYYCEKMREVF